MYPWQIYNSGMFIILAYSKPEAYSEPWHIQNSDTFRTRDKFRNLCYSELEAYSEHCKTSMMKHFEKQLRAIITFTNYIYFCNISFSYLLVHEINMIFFNTGLIFTLEVLIQYKKVWRAMLRGRWTVNFDLPPQSFTVILLVTFDFQHFLT